ncbi:MAG: triphosphoribosyl-dephospho-CoA synthase [Promethearchaeota archaeon]
MQSSPKFWISSHSSLILTWKYVNQWEFGHDKPGNVGPTNQSKGISFSDYQRVNEAIFSELSQNESNISTLSIGKLILRAVSSMMDCSPHQNLLLGNILLLSPLLLAGSQLSAQYPHHQNFSWDEFWNQVSSVLTQSSVQDTKDIIQAINLTSPGGLDSPGGINLTSIYDITKTTIKNQIETQNLSILDLFRESARYDTISSEWVSNYALCKNWLKVYFEPHCSISQATNMQEFILEMFLQLLATFPDSLIFRKNTHQVSEDIRQEADTIVQAGSLFTREGKKLLDSFNYRLNSSKGKLNPGTTADLIACLLFLASLLGWLPEYFGPSFPM